MSNHVKVTYALIYEGGSKSTHGTTLIMETDSASEAERKIRQTGNFNGSHIKEIQILKMEKS